MIDHAAHYQTVVKDEVTNQARAFFLPAKDVGFAIQQCFAPHPNMGLAPAWIVTMSVASHLLGKGPVGQGAPIYGLLISDREIRDAVKAIAEVVARDWHAEVEGTPDLSNLTIPGEVIK